MGHLSWLSEAQMRRIAPCSPQSHGMPRVDDRRVISGIIFVIKNGLRRRDRPRDCGVPKMIYNPIAARAGPGFSAASSPKYRPWGLCRTIDNRCARTIVSAFIIAANVVFWLDTQ